MVSLQLLLRILTITYISLGYYCRAFTTTTTKTGLSRSSSSSSSQTAISSSTVPTDTSSPSSSWFSSNDGDDDDSSTTTSTSSVISVERLKIQLLQLGAALDRGQAYNPTSGSYYEENMNVARNKIEQLLDQAAAAATSTVPNSLEDIDGEWELILSTVPHGIFRSSPFFLAIQVRFVDRGLLLYYYLYYSNRSYVYSFVPYNNLFYF